MDHTLVFVHICAGVVGIASGAAALTFLKGGSWHRKAGRMFVLSMVLMASLGAYGALLKPEALSVLQGLFTIYLLSTAWLAVKRKAGATGKMDYVAFVFVLSLSIAFMAFGIEALNSESGTKHGFPAAAYFVFGTVAVLATALDLRMIIRKGIYGAQRVARHLWRMCYALFIGVASLFLGQPQVFPVSIRRTELLAVPVILVLVLMIVWLVRVLYTKAYKKAEPI